MRLKANANTNSPKTALEILRRPQTHRAQIARQHLSGIGRIPPQHLDLFSALGIKKPA